MIICFDVKEFVGKAPALTNAGSKEIKGFLQQVYDIRRKSQIQLIPKRPHWDGRRDYNEAALTLQILVCIYTTATVNKVWLRGCRKLTHSSAFLWSFNPLLALSTSVPARKP